MALGTGLVKETIPAGAEKVDVRAARESGGEVNAQIPVLPRARERHRGEHSSQGRRAEDHSGGIGGANTKGEAPANTPRHAQRRGPSQGQPGKR